MAQVSYGSFLTKVVIGILRRIDAGNRCLNALLRSFIHLTSYKLFIISIISKTLNKNKY